MTNTTEMPEKIWALPNAKNDKFIVTRPQRLTGDIAYIRQDAIPSKAEVAREFIDAVNAHAQEKVDLTNRSHVLCFMSSLKEVLKEWEDVEK